MHITLIIKEKVNLKSGRSKKGLFKGKKNNGNRSKKRTNN